MSTEKDYRLAWFINDFLNIDLSKADEVSKRINKHVEVISFSHFMFENEADRYQIHLINNKSVTGNLVTEAKSVDYFLILTGEIELIIDKYIEALNNIRIIQTAFLQDKSKLKSVENLLVQ